MRSTPKAGAAFARGLAPALTRVRAAAKSFGASRWAAPLGRVALFAAGLVLLAVIGNSALAKPPKALSSVSTAAVMAAAPADVASGSDAGAQVAAVSTSEAPSMPTSPTTPAPAREPSAHGRATPDDPVVLNSASVDEFQRLPGVGPKRARAIFDLRAHIGKFRHVEDLLRVKGIGRNTLKKLRPLVRLDTAPPAPSSGAAADAGVPAQGN